MMTACAAAYWATSATTRKTFAFLAGLENSFELKTLRECKRIISVQHNVIY